MTPQLHEGTYPSLQAFLLFEQPIPKKLEHSQYPGLAGFIPPIPIRRVAVAVGTTTWACGGTDSGRTADICGRRIGNSREGERAGLPGEHRPGPQ
jgi:hypothetical protein